MPKKIFIGSSSERINELREIATWITDAGHIAKPWTEDDLLPLGKYVLSSLIKVSKEVDGAILIFGADDKTWYRKEIRHQPRDNVLVEFGLFASVLGEEQVIIVTAPAKKDSNNPTEGNPGIPIKEDSKIPTDLGGLIYADFQNKYRVQKQIEQWLDELPEVTSNDENRDEHFSSKGERENNFAKLAKKISLHAGEFDKYRRGNLVEDNLKKALFQEGSNISIIGTSLNSIFGDKGSFIQLVRDRLVEKFKFEKMRVLILDPLGMSAIIRSAGENTPLRDPMANPLDLFCGHDLETHKNAVLYKDVKNSLDNLKECKEINELKDRLEFRVYSNMDPVFAISTDDFVITESLIQNRNSKKASSIDQATLAGQFPMLFFGRGSVHTALRNSFDYIWDNLSIPYLNYNENVREKYYKINRFMVLLNLQDRYWDKQWKHRTSVSDFKDLLEYFDCSELKVKSILSLGCGNGGGGSLEILKKSLDNGVSFEILDVSASAIAQYQDNARKRKVIDGNLEENGVRTTVSDMLSFLQGNKDGGKYGLIYANQSIIYMTRIKALEIYKEIHRNLAEGGIFVGSFFSSNYDDMDTGEHNVKDYRPNHEFELIPVEEDLRIITNGERKGEIRRFYRSEEELVGELSEFFDKQKMKIETKGKYGQMIYVVAEK